MNVITLNFWNNSNLICTHRSRYVRRRASGRRPHRTRRGSRISGRVHHRDRRQREKPTQRRLRHHKSDALEEPERKDESTEIKPVNSDQQVSILIYSSVEFEILCRWFSILKVFCIYNIYFNLLIYIYLGINRIKITRNICKKKKNFGRFRQKNASSRFC